LEQLGVVSDKAKKLLFKLKEYGEGKVTGGGGKKDSSGYILFYAKDIDKTKKILEGTSIPYMSFVPSYTGLMKEL